MHTLIIPSYYPNTYNSIDGIYFRTQAEELAKANVKVGVIAPIIIKHYILLRVKKIDYGLKIPKSYIPTFVYQLPSFPVFKAMNDWMRLRYGKKLFNKYITEHGLPDIIHVQSFENGILARWIKKKFGIPFILTEHTSRFSRNTLSNRLLELAKKSLSEANKVLVVSKSLQNTLKQKLGVNSNVIPNFIDTSFFSPNNTEDKRYEFITVGSLSETKNFELLIHSFNQISNKESRLAIIGLGPERNKLISLTKELGISERVIFLGAKDPSEIVTLLNQSKIFVSSSRIETFGISIIEAMSCGLPVVATKSGGPEDVITNENLGLLCEQNQNDLSKAMQTVLDNYNSYDSTLIRNHIIENYSSTKIIQQVIGIYSNTLE